MSRQLGTYDALTFDCYGTLVDWRSGLLQAVRSHSAARYSSLDEERFLADRQREEQSLQAGPFRPYRQVVALSVQRALQHQQLRLPEEEAAAIASTVGTWKPFPDTVKALKILGTGRALDIVSNVDAEDMERTRAQIGVPLDVVVTADQVRSYKPGLAHYYQVLQELDLPREKVLHVAQSLYHDIEPAGRMDLDTVWVNRLDETLPDDPAPLTQVPDLATLAARLGPAS